MKITQKGFSLIELMVVVAIIGILATVAVPQVNKFMAKAKQSEAKATLSSLYTSEKAFYTEYNTYWAYFTTIGFSPEGRVRYDGGFSAAGAAVCPAALTATCNAGAFNITTYCTGTAPCTPATELTGGATTAGQAFAVNPTGTTFRAYASSEIISGSTDVWTIDQSKMISQQQNGIP